MGQRPPIPAAPGRPEASITSVALWRPHLFVFLDAHRCWRRVKVTGRRTAEDFALCMRELLDVDFPEAERIRVVLDNLSTHTVVSTPPSHRPSIRRLIREARLQRWCPLSLMVPTSSHLSRTIAPQRDPSRRLTIMAASSSERRWNPHRVRGTRALRHWDAARDGRVVPYEHAKE
jgi:DDE superfamily endonuclease